MLTEVIPPLEPISPDDIVRIRNARNWKRSQLATFLGCNYSTVWRMESGAAKIEGPCHRLLQQLKAQKAAA
ncbi:hypothetical protein [Mesorhizobium sp. M8A.F.Ca.ET.165.01.1.1]|uniref:helix-turn-helix domain-containing protein n=1 Tax=Mesorhizobium sp. M8A.F.Ca.ET.165.01.1.1 TaxID=2563960 RepID=UPI001093C24B|nr:hypothetical protein [Mesorhizobium sp. M8A.F.Ca.ET.165.01.1.1]TGT36197.1 hypothetical protein EN808_29880 [Mesorhizobium sp. M8A.F.Ca.ET.165.01.1.1]